MRPDTRHLAVATVRIANAFRSPGWPHNGVRRGWFDYAASDGWPRFVDDEGYRWSAHECRVAIEWVSQFPASQTGLYYPHQWRQAARQNRLVRLPVPKIFGLLQFTS